MMKKGVLRKALVVGLSVFSLLVLVLVLHVYIVTRPRADENTRIMARIDTGKFLQKSAADSISAWMYRQPGVDHVLCNASTGIIVFTYAPLKGNANKIAADFAKQPAYSNAKRYVPTEAELKGGCPVRSSSFTYKAYSYIKHIF